ncbi:hypothetical protein [Paraburkholderia youngii]|uniref:Uncharacterized protein n=1 Tax=Paraburkholderia youngii TaxID=2782701 RepID=A0A7W8P580_9BURK|nr:hypothetical protein [Paraburkholderia youngii]MBB5405179.1 hypothetical protein [Paraburkholderia youngii]
MKVVDTDIGEANICFFQLLQNTSLRLRLRCARETRLVPTVAVERLKKRIVEGRRKPANAHVNTNGPRRLRNRPLDSRGVRTVSG